jgi:RNA-directed DNA polymerase
MAMVWPSEFQARQRVLQIQTKLHGWAGRDPARVFDDLFNLVVDPAFLLVAWYRVRENKGARTAGVDGTTAYAIEASASGVEGFLARLRTDVKSGVFRPLPVRERMIPKTGGKLRRLGIPTVADRVVQASLKLVLEPIWENDFHPCSYGFRPGRRAQDAIEEIRMFAHKTYEWVFEGDIAACFDSISHAALMDRVRMRIGDKRVLGLVKAFLKAGILSETGDNRETTTGTPQGGILSPLLANVALSVLDEHFAGIWQQHSATKQARASRKRRGLPNYRLVRYADDFVVMVSGAREQAEGLWGEVAAVIATVGLTLAPDKTKIAHIDEGFDFLGFHIRRCQQKGSDRRYVYSYPSGKAIDGVKRKVKAASRQMRNAPLSALLRKLAAVMRGWVMYFRHGASKKTFAYLGAYAWYRVRAWIRYKHPKRTWKWLRHHYGHDGRWAHEEVVLFNPEAVPIVRYRYRGANIPTPWIQPDTA